MPPFAPLIDYPRVKRVGSFQELVSTPLAQGINALCWERTLAGDFAEVVKLLGDGGGEPITTLDEAKLLALPISPSGRLAVDHMLADLRLLRDRELDPVLNCIHGYPRDEEPGPVVTDVFSFHADSAPIPADTWLCTYCGPSSEGLRNEDALRKVDDPAIRAELMKHYGEEQRFSRPPIGCSIPPHPEKGFSEYLRDHCYDLHYAATPRAQPYSFGHFNLWRIATDYPDSPVPPCIHRAPATHPGDPARLLLIS
ncbi:MAG: hypothetical protein H7343_05535 [Undibacterium sp.]|nr:hypothetical protein [Opitutaceae bacterium]